MSGAYSGVQALLPGPLRRYILHFETAIETAVERFSAELSTGALVLDAGAGEGQYQSRFSTRHRYVGVDLGIGDTAWDYAGLDALADLMALPFRDCTFDGCLNIVTLEHVRDPARVIEELHRVLKPGGELLLIVPHEWEEHQTPHDYFRYTRYGTRHLLDCAGFREMTIEPVGGFFRLLSRRLFNALQFFPGPLMLVAAVFFAPMALVMPLLDPLDKAKNFTPGFICRARRES